MRSVCYVKERSVSQGGLGFECLEQRRTLSVEPASADFLSTAIYPSQQVSLLRGEGEAPVAIRIAALGDSQTTEEGNSYVPYLRQLVSSDRFSVTTVAHAGWKTDQVRTLWDTQVKDAGFNTVVIFAGVNDLSATERSADDTFANLQIMYSEAISRNMNIVAVGVPPWSNYSTSTKIKETRTTELNQQIEAYVAQNSGQMRFIDAYGLMQSSGYAPAIGNSL